MKLKIANELEIDLTEPPYDTQGLRVFIAGISGAGKSYAQMKFLEEAHDAGLQFVLLDVHGEGHVLSELSNNVVVASERFGIPVTIEAVDIYIDLLRSGMSLVIDLKSLYWQARSEFLEFTHRFLREFMAKWANVVRPILLAMDEAQEIAPQTQTKGSADLVKVVSEIITGGRKSGVHSLLASQRPAKIDKTAISQANVRLIGQLTATQDWSAIKEYAHGFSFKDIRGFRSGDFISAAEGAAEKIRVLKRRTKDAGATPTIKTRFSKVQKSDMKEIADKITKAIQDAKQHQESESTKDERIKYLEKKVETKDEEKKELESKLDMVEFVAEKFGGARVQGKVEVPSEFVDVKAEFERELDKLRKKMQKELQSKDNEMQKELRSKDNTILKLEKEVEATAVLPTKLAKFRDLFQELMGNPFSPGSTGDNIDVDDIVARVVAKVGNGGPVYEVAPLEALKKDWEKNVHENVIRLIDSLDQKAIMILSYLTASGQHTKTAICKALWNADGGSAFKAMGEALKELTGKKLVFQNSRGYGSRVNKIVDDYLEGLSEDTSNITEHVIEHIRQKGGVH